MGGAQWPTALLGDTNSQLHFSPHNAVVLFKGSKSKPSVTYLSLQVQHQPIREPLLSSKGGKFERRNVQRTFIRDEILPTTSALCMLYGVCPFAWSFGCFLPCFASFYGDSQVFWVLATRTGEVGVLQFPEFQDSFNCKIHAQQPTG